MMKGKLIIAFIACLVSCIAALPSEDINTKPSKDDMFWGLDEPRETYKVPKLPFSFDAMEPFIDSETMKIHYTDIFEHYTTKLNEFLKKWRESGKEKALAKSSLIKMWRKIKDIPDEFKRDFLQYGGGYLNSVLYFSTMTANPKAEKRNSTEGFYKLVDRSFHNITELQRYVNETADELFGSGFVWLVRVTGRPEGDFLSVVSTLEEMSPLENPVTSPILGVDMWEHAYFKKYGNKRNEYIENWWKVVDWRKVERLLKWWRRLEPEIITKKIE